VGLDLRLKGRVMAGKYQNEDLRERFGLSHETIRRYALDFAEFLSEGATPKDRNKHRFYNDSDLAVFDVIVTMKATNHSNNEIMATLRAGAERKIGEILGDRPILNPTMERALHKQELANRDKELETAIQRAEDAEVEAQIWRDKANRFEGELKSLKEQVQQLQQQLETAQSKQDVIALHKEIARLTVLLEIAQKKDE
jgi:DNA-binding transcriptional MerR regulator